MTARDGTHTARDISGIADTATTLRGTGDAVLLQGLARTPLIGAADLATVTGRRDTAGVRRRLRLLGGTGLVEYVVPSSDMLAPQRLHYLTDRGVRLAADLDGVPAATYARRWGVGERTLDARLCRLEHLVLTRGFLLDLLRTLPQESAALSWWQPWPVRLPYVWHGRRYTVIVDGAGTVAVRGSSGPQHVFFVLLWDDGNLDVEALRGRMRSLLRHCRGQTDMGILSAPVPRVLLVAENSARARAATRIARELAHTQETEALALLVTTDRPSLVAGKPLHVPWRGADGRDYHLPMALLLAGSSSGPTSLDGSPTLDVPAVGETTTRDRAAASVRTLVQGDFGARVREVRVGDQTSRAVSRGVAILALRPREVRALRWIGLQPFLLARQVAELVGDGPQRIARTLDALLARGLIATDLSGFYSIPARRRYILTPEGTRLLAAVSGQTNRDYLRYTGAIAGLLNTASSEIAAGEDSQNPQAWHEQGSHLEWMYRYLDHTVAMHSVFLQFVRATRSTHGTAWEIVLEEWRGEWACRRAFPHDGARHILRPDAYGRCRTGTETLTFYIELDRGTYSAGGLRRKIESYSAYRASGAWRRDTSAFPFVLIITTGEGRLRTLFTLNAEVAAAQLALPLLLLATTQEDVCSRGPLAPIWRFASGETPHPLLPVPVVIPP